MAAEQATQGRAQEANSEQQAGLALDAQRAECVRDLLCLRLQECRIMMPRCQQEHPLAFITGLDTFIPRLKMNVRSSKKQAWAFLKNYSLRVESQSQIGSDGGSNNAKPVFGQSNIIWCKKHIVR